MQKYAFLDRDGTIIWEPERPEGVDPRETYPLQSPQQVQFLPGALEGMQKLVEKGFKLVLATNQTFLGTPKNPQNTFDAVMERISTEMAKYGLQFEFMMICPHGPDEGCDCRKPLIGGLKNFLEEREGNVDLEHSLMFGDRATDEGFARNLGVQFVKITTNQAFQLPENV